MFLAVVLLLFSRLLLDPGVYSNKHFTTRLALNNSQNSYEISECIFEHIRATDCQGAAVFLQTTKGTLSLSHDGFFDCAVGDGSGGAIYAAVGYFDQQTTCFSACDAARFPVAYVSSEKSLTATQSHITQEKPKSSGSFGFACFCEVVEVTSSNFSDNEFEKGAAILSIHGASGCQYLHFEQNRCKDIAMLTIDAHGDFQNANFVRNKASSFLFENMCFSLEMKKCCYVRDESAAFVNGHCSFVDCSFDLDRAGVQQKLEVPAQMSHCEFEIGQTFAFNIVGSNGCWGKDTVIASSGSGNISAPAAMMIGLSVVAILIAAGFLYTKMCSRKHADTGLLMYVSTKIANFFNDLS
jgi:hypothetical protein